MLQPNADNKTFQAVARSKAKMYEYGVPVEQHINLQGMTLTDLLDLTIGMLGTLAASSASGDLREEKYRLLFSAQYFLALIEGKSSSTHIELLRLLASAGFFLADYPGSSQVILKELDTTRFSRLEMLLAAILNRGPVTLDGIEDEAQPLSDLFRSWNALLEGATAFEALIPACTAARKHVYAVGGDEDLLVIDLIRALVLKRSVISSKAILEAHSGADAGLWDTYFGRAGSIKEFWPAQVRLAEKGIFSGTSAIVQMPTSAGKTKATEFIIRSCFLANRGTLAIVVAPFRALCQEIFNDYSRNFEQDADIDVGLVSDVMQDDFLFETDNRKSILILTPEKLDFLLRYNPELTGQIGLIIYDEGHLFDDSSRGVKYELLLSSLKARLPATSQVVLISAVISNAQEVKEWLLNESGVLVDGKDLSPTNRNIAFVDWTNRGRNLQFVNDTNISQPLFYVPTVLQSHELAMKPLERARRFYPALHATNRQYIPTQVAGFLGCRLAAGGLSAVFTGRKDSAQKIATELVNAYDREFPVRRPSEFSENPVEAQKVVSYIGRILGEESINAQAAGLGILMHHGNIPHGLRLVTETALQESHFKMVVCTSTLAQGVNLPIRYLIISTDRQGRERIKTRDFHNLMGRAGRSGKYTEGTVIFANPGIYRTRTLGGRSSWYEAKQLLDATNSEPSKSRLLQLLEDPESLADDQKMIWESQTGETRREIYSYLLIALGEVEDILEMERVVTELVRGTLGHSQLSSDEDKLRLQGIFIEIGSEILTAIPDLSMRPIFSKSILTLAQSNEVLELLRAILPEIIVPDANLLEILWPILHGYSRNNILASFREPDALTLCKSWIAGESFQAIQARAHRMLRVQGNALAMGHLIELCEGGFSYAVSTLFGTVTELASAVISPDDFPRVALEMKAIQKQLRYGVSSALKARIYELGFCDRELCSQVSALLGEPEHMMPRRTLVNLIRDQGAIPALIEGYPSYFRYRFNSLA